MTQMMGTMDATQALQTAARSNVVRIDPRGSETSAPALQARLMEVEAEHLRLQRLVGELLMKNQKLRELLCDQAGMSKAAAEFCQGDGAIGQGSGSSH